MEKGQAQNQVLIYFPASIDIAWFRSPKFQSGQKGLFILRRPEEPELPKTGFTALNPLDFQPTTERERIRRLLLKR